MGAYWLNIHTVLQIKLKTKAAARGSLRRITGLRSRRSRCFCLSRCIFMVFRWFLWPTSCVPFEQQLQKMVVLLNPRHTSDVAERASLSLTSGLQWLSQLLPQTTPWVQLSQSWTHPVQVVSGLIWLILVSQKSSFQSCVCTLHSGLRDFFSLQLSLSSVVRI